MHPATLERLEFPQLKELLRARVTCAPGQRTVEALAPSADRSWIERELARVAEARWLLEQGEELGFGGLADPASLLAKLPVADLVLAPQELLDLTGLLEFSTSARQHLGAPRHRQSLPHLRELAAELHDFSALERDIRRRLLPGGELDDYASPALAEFRGQIAELEAKLHRALRRVLERAAARGALQDEFVTLRGGRLVLPIRTDARTRPEGVVHAQSGTRQTLFLEPLETIALNNDLVRLREEEALEVRRILRALTERLAARRAELERAAAVLGELDSLFARARYARDFRCTLPALAEPATSGLELRAARHPLLQDARRRAAQDSIVPISLRLAPDQRVLVISGPNAGGKTAALKTVGLAALAAQAGIPVPAEEARLPVFARILADIGDEQSLVENLSTFSAHIRNLGEMAAAADPDALVLLDELGAATSPEEGAALGVALLEHFRRRGALTLATTHHERLKAYAAATPGAVNAAVEFDEANLRPAYRLLVGLPGVSSGLEMAARLGLPAEIVAAARRNISAEDTESAELIRSLHQTQQELEQLQSEVRSELERLREERERLARESAREQRQKLAELERALEASLAAHRKELRAVVDTLKDPRQREKLEKLGSRQLGKVAADARREFDATVVQRLGGAARPGAVTLIRPEALEPGARVKLRGIARRGVILSKLGAESIEVQVGSLRMRVGAGDIEQVEKAKTEIRKGKIGKAPSTNVPLELHLRGLRVEEALEKADKFLDEAVLAEHAEVRIVHGIGTGKLKKALAEFLAAHPHVESAREAHREHGGAGVMVVQLKRN
jgi:DNA mismatch repair protein MutS2